MTNKKCAKPPMGWYCTRQRWHKGPCAAYKTIGTLPVWKGFSVVNEAGDLIDYPENGATAFNSKEELLYAYKDWNHSGRETLNKYNWRIIRVSIMIL